MGNEKFQKKGARPPWRGWMQSTIMGDGVAFQGAEKFTAIDPKFGQIGYIQKKWKKWKKEGIDTMKPINPDGEDPAPIATKRYDPLLDPLPQPDVVESDTETAWGRWEDLVASGGGTEEAEPPPPNFEDTVPMGGLDAPPRRKF